MRKKNVKNVTQGIQMKFDIGQEVYLIQKLKKNYSKTLCSFCGGDKTIVGKNPPNLTTNCPMCRGSGEFITHLPDTYAITSWDSSKLAMRIVEIHYTSDGEKKYFLQADHDYRCEYEGNAFGRYVPEDLFASVDEAQTECDKRNKLITGGDAYLRFCRLPQVLKLILASLRQKKLVLF